MKIFPNQKALQLLRKLKKLLLIYDLEGKETNYGRDHIVFMLRLFLFNFLGAIIINHSFFPSRLNYGGECSQNTVQQQSSYLK